VKGLLFVYFFLSGITWVAGRAGEGISGRLALSDPIMAIIIFVAFASHHRDFRIPSVGGAALAMVTAFGVGVAFSASPSLAQPLIAWMIHLFVVLGFLAIYNIVVVEPMEVRIQYAQLWIRAAGLIAVLALYDFVAPMVGLPQLASFIGRSSRIRGGAVGTFRNTGQAGIFFVTAIAMALPLQRISIGRARQEVNLWFIVLGLATAFTVKRSALVALAIILTLFFIRERGWRGKARTLMTVGIAACILIPAAGWLWETSPAFRWRVNKKLDTQVVTELGEGDGFIMETAGVALTAFSDRPLVGVGLAGVAGIYSDKYEVHNTYLSVLAESGLLGILVYGSFVVVLFRGCARPKNDDPRTEQFSRLIIPGLVGLFIAYGYTNHLRKREFWTTVALATSIIGPLTLRPLPTAAGALTPLPRRTSPRALPLETN
jgi:O-antigen ligase